MRLTDNIRNAYLPLAGLLLATLLFRLPSLIEPPWYDDEGIYAAVAHALLKGEALYRTILDNRPPGIYWLYEFFLAVSGHTVFGVKLGATAFVLFTQVTMFFIGWRVAGRKTGLVVAGLFGFLISLPLLEGDIANAEIFMIFPMALGMLLLLRGMPFWAGVAMGCALLIKQITGLELLAALIAVALFYPNARKTMLLMVVGYVVPIIVTSLYLLSQDSFKEFLFAGWGYYVGYAQRGARLPSEVWPLKMALLMVSIAVIGWHYRGRREVDGFHRPLFALWTVLALFGSVFTMRGYVHYLLEALPPLLLWLTTTTYPHFSRSLTAWRESLSVVRVGKWATASALVVTSMWLLVGIYNPWPNWARPQRAVQYYQNYALFVTGNKTVAQYGDFFDQRVNRNLVLAKYLRTHARPTDYLMIWGEEPWIYPLTGMKVASPFTISYYAYEMPSGLQRVVSSIEQRKPTYFIWTTNKPLFPELKALLERDYTAVATSLNAQLLQRTVATSSVSSVPLQMTPEQINTP